MAKEKIARIKERQDLKAKTTESSKKRIKHNPESAKPQKSVNLSMHKVEKNLHMDRVLNKLYK